MMSKKKSKKNMVFKVVVVPQARIDIFEAIEWYGEKSVTTAKRFNKTIKEYYKILRRNPFFQVRYEGVRCLPLKGFPYMIHFIVEEEHKKVIILGVVSTGRKPSHLLDRVP